MRLRLMNGWLESELTVGLSINSTSRCSWGSGVSERRWGPSRARGKVGRSWLLKTEAASVFGLDRAVGVDLDGENKIAGGAGVVEVAFAG
jgi:hypothetical protein